MDLCRSIPTFPGGNVEVVLATPTMPVFFGNIFGIGVEILERDVHRLRRQSAPAIWSGGNCGSPTGLQMNGGPFTINGSVVSYGPLNFFTCRGARP